MHNLLEKTRAVVLHQIKYSDSGIVVHIYTRRFGRIPVMIKGARNKKMGRHTVMFQPMCILDVEMYYRHSREIQLLREFSMPYPPAGINNDIKKSVVALFLGEVLSLVLREESPNELMFDFIENSVMWFNECESCLNFHISFLSGLSRYLGFEPARRRDPDDVFFNLRNGNFIKMPPDHQDYAPENISGYLNLFFGMNYHEAGKIALTGKQRNEILETMVKYYSHHLSLRKINSLDVLREVFGG
jgi:DNA repair protein RecO (recombination protein O)